MGEFLERTLSRVPSGFNFGEPLIGLFSWVEDQGFVSEGVNGDLYGDLNGGGRFGTGVELRGFPPDETDEYVTAWFGAGAATAAVRLWPFAQTGDEGSMAALWLDDVGVTRVVHLGSGSGSMLTCVLAEDQVDFLRLLAIGYVEICWNQEFASPPKPWWDDYAVENRPFRAWVSATFDTTIPATALEIVREPSEMGDEATKDPFCRLVNRLTG